MEFINLYGAEHQHMRANIRGLLFSFAKDEVIISNFVIEGCVEKLLELQGSVYEDFDNKARASNDRMVVQRLQLYHYHMLGIVAFNERIR